MTPSFLVRCALMLSASALLLTLSTEASGQQTAARPDRGAMPGASYSVSDIESISLTNGNVNLSIPLAALPPIAGGKLGFSVNAVYNSKIWDVTRTEVRPDTLLPTYVRDNLQVNANGTAGGWKIGGAYSLEFV